MPHQQPRHAIAMPRIRRKKDEVHAYEPLAYIYIYIYIRKYFALCPYVMRISDAYAQLAAVYLIGIRRNTAAAAVFMFI